MYQYHVFQNYVYITCLNSRQLIEELLLDLVCQSDSSALGTWSRQPLAEVSSLIDFWLSK